jgi:hypothetical protein
MITTTADKVDYIIPSPAAMFALSANMVPFMQNNSGNRVSYGTHHSTQALSLKDREAPLVAVSTGGKGTFEQLIGSYFSSFAPADGVVRSVSKTAITIKGKDGKLYRRAMYDNYPLNDKTSFLSSIPAVKVGDAVHKGQLIAGNNYSDAEGTLALGKNLKVAYLPFYSTTYDDSIAISQTASEKLTSLHLYKERVDINEDTVLDRNKFRSMYRDRITDVQAAKLDENGVIKEGTVVEPGDTLVACLRKRNPSEEELLVKGISKALVRPYADKSIRWESQYPGKVERVVVNHDNVMVHVSSEEPAGVGDKLCYDDKTEILTKRGWLFFKDLKDQDAVLTLAVPPEHPKYSTTLKQCFMEWQTPSRILAYEHVGKMYQVETNLVSIKVTTNHTMLVYPVTSRGVEHLSLLAANLCRKRPYYLPITGTQFKDAADPKKLAIGGRKFPTEKILQFLASVYRAGEIIDGQWCVREKYARDIEALMHELSISFRTEGDKFFILDNGLNKVSRWTIPEGGFTLSKETLHTFVYRALLRTNHNVGLFTREEKDLWQHLAVLAGVVTECKEVNGLFRLFSTRHYRNGCAYINHDIVEDSYGRYRGMVYCCTVPNGTLVVRRNNKVFLSGNCGRHGNKGVIGVVLPTDQMPKTMDGEAVDIVLNPISTSSRVIVGPMLETSLAKAVEKEGKGSVAVTNFSPTKEKRLVHVKGHWRTVETEEGSKRIYVEPYSYERNYTAQVKEALGRAGVSETEDLLDPVSGKILKNVLVGKQYMMKQVHQAEKKMAARAGGPGYDYDGNMSPRGSGDHGAQSIGELGNHALLAHGAVTMMREGATLKSDCSQDEVWTAIQLGEPLPPPRPSFAYNKFLGLLAAMGVNVDKTGSQLTLSPLTDADILKMSNGELQNPALTLRSKDLQPEEGGLFDKKITGGLTGERWCFVSDTRVLTEYGLLSIGEIVRERLEIRVWSYDFEAKSLVLKPIVNWFETEGTEVGKASIPVNEGSYKNELTGTPRHNIVTYEGTKLAIEDAREVVVVEYD